MLPYFFFNLVFGTGHMGIMPLASDCIALRTQRQKDVKRHHPLYSLLRCVACDCRMSSSRSFPIKRLCAAKVAAVHQAIW